MALLRENVFGLDTSSSIVEGSIMLVLGHLSDFCSNLYEINMVFEILERT